MWQERVFLTLVIPAKAGNQGTRVDRFQTMLKKTLCFIFGICAVIVFLPIIIALILISLASWPIQESVHYLRGRWLRRRFDLEQVPQGKYIVFVYSDNWRWKEYVEREILPRIRPFALPVNWSKRSHWRDLPPPEAKIARYYGGDEVDFQPRAIVMLPGQKTSIIRFRRALIDYHLGWTTRLEACEKELYDIVEVLRQSQSEP